MDIWIDRWKGVLIDRLWIDKQTIDRQTERQLDIYVWIDNRYNIDRQMFDNSKRDLQRAKLTFIFIIEDNKINCSLYSGS